MKYTSVTVRQLTRNGKPWRWQARAKYKAADGKWKEVNKVFPDAKGIREAKKMANAWLDELNAQAEVMPSAGGNVKTVEDVFINYIKHQLDTGEIEKSTYSNTIASYKRYIHPYLGEYIFATVDMTVINGWLTKLYKNGLSQSTVHTNFKRLKKVYNYYYENGEILNHPFKGVKQPKRGKPKVTHLTDEQMDEVLAAVYLDYEPKDAMYVGVLLAFYAGLRRGEICGLRWNDIDFKKHIITVRSAVGVAKGIERGSYTKNPKNSVSNRSFPIMPKLEEALKQRYNAIKPINNWFVIGEQDRFMRPNQFSKLFKEFRDRNNLIDAYGVKVMPHGLRHNFATVGIRSGMDIASLALMMGHASRAMTLDTYGDANADALNLASVKLAEKFNSSSEYFGEEQEEEE